MHGQGEFKWKDGRRYVGEYHNDKKEGYGEFYWPTGKCYKGQWKDGKQNGNGELTKSEFEAPIRGNWANGSRIT